jgi:hypothetical protein
LSEPNEQHFDAGIVNADPAGHGHDGGDDARKQRGARVCHRETNAAGDLIRGADDDVVIVAGEEPAAEERREQPQRCRDGENADPRPVYWSSPVFRTFW